MTILIGSLLAGLAGIIATQAAGRRAEDAAAIPVRVRDDRPRRS